MMGNTTTEARRDAQRGFTLIEMSVVLVIIGLLIGGILQGQEMINNTRIKTTIAQVDATTAAVQSFDDKFGALPGDFDQATGILGAATNGNGNGAIANNGQASDSRNANQAAAEGPVVWEHLNLAGFIQGSNTDSGNWGLEGKMSGVFLEVFTMAYPANETHLVVRMRGDTGGAPDNALTIEDAFALDNKYDDGLPNTGRYRGNTNGGTCAAGGADAATYADAGVNAGVQCITTIEID